MTTSSSTFHLFCCRCPNRAVWSSTCALHCKSFWSAGGSQPQSSQLLVPQDFVCSFVCVVFLCLHDFAALCWLAWPNSSLAQILRLVHLLCILDTRLKMVNACLAVPPNKTGPTKMSCSAVCRPSPKCQMSARPSKISIFRYGCVHKLAAMTFS